VSILNRHPTLDWEVRCASKTPEAQIVRVLCQPVNDPDYHGATSTSK